MRAALLLLGAVVALASAGRVTLEGRAVTPAEWVKVARAPQDTRIPFVVALKQQNLAELDARFWAASTPGTYVRALPALAWPRACVRLMALWAVLSAFRALLACCVCARGGCSHCPLTAHRSL